MTDRELLESMSKQLEQLVHHVAEVRQSNWSLEARLDRLQADVDGIRTDVDGLRTDVDGLRTDVDGIRSDVDGIRSDVDGIRSDVDGIRSDVDGLRTDVDSMRGDIQALDRKIDEKTDFIGGKIEHFITFFGDEMTRHRAHLEETHYTQLAYQRQTDKRLHDIEQRVARLEAAPS